MSLIEVKNITKRFDEKIVLGNISFSIEGKRTKDSPIIINTKDRGSQSMGNMLGDIIDKYNEEVSQGMYIRKIKIVSKHNSAFTYDISILVVEDDGDINNLLYKILSKEGYNVRQAYSGSEVKMCLELYDFQLVLLGLMLPGVTGEELISQLRKVKTMPIIVILAKPRQDIKIEVLRLGADDFISKPFDVNEVLARVEAQLRRYMVFSNTEKNDDILKHKDLVLNREKIEVTVKGEEIILTARQFAILYFLSRRDIDNIGNQLHEINNTSTSSKILNPTSNKQLGNLVLEINKSLEEKQRTEVEYKRIDMEFKQAIANVSHDLRTPLTSIMGYIQLMDDDELSIEERNQYINIVKKQDKITSNFDF